MYLKTTKRRYKGKTYTSYLLVESVSTPKGPRQRTVCSLGDLFDPADDEMQAIVAKVKAYRARRAAETDDDEVIRVSANEVETEEHREGGTVHVGHEFWKRLGLDEILRDLGLSERMCALVCVLIMNRLIDPKAEYAIPDWVRRTALGDILGADFTELAEDALYRAMDKVHPHRAAIESALVERESEVFYLDRTVFFYDLTSTYFEGLAKSNGKTKRGYSRDERRVDTHIFLSVMAYHLLVAIEKTLLDQNIHTSWAALRDKLKTHQVCTVVLPTDTGEVLRIRKSSSPEPVHRRIYRLLDLPDKIMEPHKTWNSPTTKA